MNKFEFKNLVKNLKDSLKEKTFFKELRKEVEIGANGTQDYVVKKGVNKDTIATCLLYTSPSPRDVEESRMPSSA